MARYTPRLQRAQRLMRDFLRYSQIRKHLAHRRACRRLIAKQPVYTRRATPASSHPSHDDSEAESSTSMRSFISSLGSESPSQASSDSASSPSHLSSSSATNHDTSGYSDSESTTDADSEYSYDSSVSSFDSEEETSTDEYDAPHPQTHVARRVRRTV
jgi:hypothetical protein